MKSNCARASGRLCAALLFCVVGASSAVVRAVPPEFLRNIALHPTDPDVFAVRYESGFGGVLFSRDGGKSLQIVPARSFYQYDLHRAVPTLMASDGKLQIALDSGLLLDDGRGCFPAIPSSAPSYSEPALDGLWVADLAAHPSDPSVSFLLTTGSAAAKPGKHAGLWRRDKQGVLSPLGMGEVAAADAGSQLPFIASSLRVVARAASSDGLRFFVTGTKYDYSVNPALSTPVLRVSDNAGMTWTSHTIPDPGKTQGSPRIVLVDPSEPFKAIVALENGFGDDSSDPLDPLFITKDGGQSFTPYLDSVQVIGEAVQLPSGQVLIADRGAPGGLYSAASFDAVPSKVADYSVRCLAYQATTKKLFMCKLAELGLYDAAANSFCAFFRMNEVTGFPSCPAAPLAQNTKAADQLCGGWCGAAHYASTPVCSMFPVSTGRLCGPAAHAYDREGDDPEKLWVEPPGDNASPRCVDSTPADAGVAQLPESDAAEPTSDDAGTKKQKDKSGDCRLALAGEQRDSGAGLLASLALVLALALRRARRASQR